MRRWALLLALVPASIGVVAACVGGSPDVEGTSDAGNASSSGNTSSGGSSGASSSGGSSSGGSSSGSSGEAGMDARTPCDAAIPARNANSLTCPDASPGEDPCTFGQCCYNPNADCLNAVVTSCTLTFRCDKASDCDAGSYCCLSANAPSDSCPAVAANALGSKCEPAPCANNQIELCGSQQVCKNGATCGALTVQVGTSNKTRLVGGCF
jgi:hypothetical protein